MHMKRRLRRYISNIISFTNAKTRNTMRDRSEDFYADEVTPELIDLMRSVWKPIVGPDHEIIVVHVQKSRRFSNLGISLKGVTYVSEPVFDKSASNHVTSTPITPDHVNHQQSNGINIEQSKSEECRHFIQHVVVDGLIGSLNVVRNGDELLQVNGRRLRGLSHTKALRFLRGLPSRIELVLARSKSSQITENFNHDSEIFENDKLGFDCLDVNEEESPLELRASEVGSVDTAASFKSSERKFKGPPYSVPYDYSVSPALTQQRVSEWIRRSQSDLLMGIPYPPESPFQDHAVRHQPNHSNDKNENVNSSILSQKTNQSIDSKLINRKYSLPDSFSHTMPRLRTHSVENNSTIGMKEQQQQIKSSKVSSKYSEDYARRTQTLPRKFKSHSKVIDPRYGSKRPVWSSVPLVIELTKTQSGFGFSFSEYEELPVTNVDEKNSRKAFTLGRRSSVTESDSRSIRSNYTSSVLEDNFKKSSSLKRRSTWSSRSKHNRHHNKGALIIDSIVPDGAAERDGRISIGDRLLFVNDRNLIKASVREATEALKSIPYGSCLIGIAKMQFESNIAESDLIQTDNPDYSNPLHVNSDLGFDNLMLETLKLDSSDDRLLDYQSKPLLCPNPELHSHDLQCLPPIDPNLEQTVQIDRGDIPIGIRLDALAVQGQDGCRIVQILGGGAIALNGVLSTNDYITSINGLSLRCLTNLQAFQTIHNVSKTATMIVINYFPSSIVELHRFNYLSKIMNPSPNSENIQTISPPPNWSQFIEIVIYREDLQQDWGLSFGGEEICSGFGYTIPTNITHPILIAEIKPQSAADNCKLLTLGLLIVKINDIYLTDYNVINANELLSIFNKQLDHELRLVISHFDHNLIQPPYPIENGVISPKLQTLPIDKVHCSGGSPSSSDQENPEPLTELEVRGDLSSFQRTVPSPELNFIDEDNNHSHHQNGDVNQKSDTKNLQNQFDLSNLSYPILTDKNDLKKTNKLISTGAVPTTTTTTTTLNHINNSSIVDDDDDDVVVEKINEDEESVLQSLSVNGSPPPIPPRKFSESTKQGLINLRKSFPESDISYESMRTRYCRDNPPGDEIFIVNLPLPLILFDSDDNTTTTTANSTAGSYKPSRIEHLGIRLVGSRSPDLIASYIAGFRHGSIAEDQKYNLLVGDEIVQVDQNDVSGLNHLFVQQSISKSLHEKAIEFTKTQSEIVKINSNPITTKVQSLSINRPSITLVVRRNPINLKLMASPNSPEPTHLNMSNSTFINSSVHDKVIDKSLESTNLPAGCNPIPHSFLKEIMCELNESFDRFQLFNVTLERGPEGFGIFIVNLGPSNESGVFVTEVRPNSPASKQGILKQHDRILAINGHLQKDYESTLELLQRSTQSVCVTIGRVLPTKEIKMNDSVKIPKNYYDIGPPNIIPGIQTTITLFRKEKGLGFSIVGGANTVLGNIMIHQVNEGGAAAEDGRLHPSDRLLAVNDIDIRDCTQEDATNIIRSTGDSIRLLVYRDPEPFNFVEGNFECCKVILKRESGQRLGLSLIGRPNYSTGTSIGEILPDSTASRSNLLNVGDIILEVNGRDVRLAKSDEVAALLKNIVGEVKLLIGRYRNPYSMHVYPRNYLCVYTVLLGRDTIENNLHHNNNDNNNIENQAQAAFGLCIREATESELLESSSCLIIKNLLPNSPAERSRMIMPGDRLLSLDHEPIDYLKPNEIVDLLRNLKACTLEFGRLPHIPNEQNNIIKVNGPVGFNLQDFEIDQYNEQNAPYSPPSQELENLIQGGLMPHIVPPKYLKEMDILDEQDEDIPNQINIDNQDNSSNLMDSHKQQQNVNNDNNRAIKEITDKEIECALNRTQRSMNGGFLIRHINLPKPINKLSKLGLHLIESSGISGPTIVRIDPNSPASQTDLQIGDRILGLNDRLLLSLNYDGKQLNTNEILQTIENIWLSSLNYKLNDDNDNNNKCCLVIVRNQIYNNNNYNSTSPNLQPTVNNTNSTSIISPQIKLESINSNQSSSSSSPVPSPKLKSLYNSELNTIQSPAILMNDKLSANLIENSENHIVAQTERD